MENTELKDQISENNKIILIGICGRKNVGKTTVRDYMSKKFNDDSYSVQLYSLASPLKKIAKILNFSEKQLYGSQEDKNMKHSTWNISSREFMQKFGTEIMRNCLPNILPKMNLGKYNNIWLQLLEQHFNNLNEEYCDKKSRVILIIDDVRFLDEAKKIRELGGTIIKIVRTDNDVNNKDCHQSEIETDLIDGKYTIINSDNKEWLYMQTDDIINVIDGRDLYKV
jgi:Cdc6-like AAA superfamily ATPase